MDFGPSNEISAVTCTPLDSSKFFATYFAVSFWGSNNVTVLALEKGEIKTVCPPTPLPALARSLLLFNFGSGRAAKDAEYHPHLLAGLADGSVVSFSFKNKELREKKIASLGTAPVFLSPCLVDGRRTVLASGNRASILYWDKQRLQQSPVMLRVCCVVGLVRHGLNVHTGHHHWGDVEYVCILECPDSGHVFGYQYWTCQRCRQNADQIGTSMFCLSCGLLRCHVYRSGWGLIIRGG